MITELEIKENLQFLGGLKEIIGIGGGKQNFCIYQFYTFYTFYTLAEIFGFGW
jgi:hypothetical protein